MSQAQSLQEFLAASNEPAIVALGRYIEGQIEESWQTLLQKHHDKLLDAYNRAGDMAYGTYCDLLFRSIHQQMKQAGLRPTPRFPGDFDISREWGSEAQNDQQRWMWSTITSAAGAELGTIVTILFHDHTQFRIPRQPQVIALAETGQEAVVEALSERSADFAQAREAKIEIEEYLRSLEHQG